MNPSWKITFPIQKTEVRADGVYIVGLASGPELDAHGERMSPEAIQLFEQQVNEQADLIALPSVDAHAHDGVLRELGEVTKAWINENFHMGVEIRLDMDNPASIFLKKQLDRGKQFGLSIGGYIVRFTDEWVEELQRVVRTYQEIVLNEISITTQPAWTPSFGSVLSKSIDAARDAESAVAEGENVLDKDELQRDETDAPEADAAPEAAEAADEAAADEAAAEKSCECPEGCEDCKGAECACKHEPAAEAEPAAEDEAEEPAEEPAAEAESTDVENSAALPAELVKALDAWFDAKLAKSQPAPQEPVSTDESAEKSDREPTVAELMTQLQAATKSLEEATARIKELEETPASQAPAAKTGDIDEVDEALKALPPMERVRAGLAAKYGR